MENTTVSKSFGYGMYAYEIFGNSLIRNSLFTDNKGNYTMHGGNMQLSYSNYSCNHSQSHFYIVSSNFTKGVSPHHASGITTKLMCITGGVHLTLLDVKMANNVQIAQATIGGDSGGGNFGSNLIPSYNSLNFIRCTIHNGYSQFGGGVYIDVYKKVSAFPVLREIVRVVNTSFVNNTARVVGGGVYILLYYSPGLSKLSLAFTFIGCTFTENQIASETEERGGVAVNILSFNVAENLLHSTPQYALSFSGCAFANNSFQIHPNAQSLSSGVMYVEKIPKITLEDCDIIDNKCTGIAAVNSYIRFTGQNVIKNNTAEYGGGLLLGDSSSIMLTVNTRLNISHNHANTFGGGIYAQTTSIHAIPPCFFQFDDKTICNPTLQKDIHVYLHNNTAGITGTAIYGGLIDHCFLLSSNKNLQIANNYYECSNSSTVFDRMFHYPNDSTGPAVISSDPLFVCLCTNNSFNTTTKDCGLLHLKQTVSPGETITISAVVVGQRNGVVPGSVVAQISSQDRLSSIYPSQMFQSTRNHCTNLEYTIFSYTEHAANLTLNVRHYFENYHSPVISVNISACPVGFQHHKNQCGCIENLQRHSITCNPQTSKIRRPTGLWIGYATPRNIKKYDAENINVIVCPHLYCIPYDVEIKAYSNHFDQDQQCNMHRTGVLCGSCKPGYSIGYGSTVCLNCTQTSLWKVPALICGDILLGVAVIVFLLSFDLTVTKGAINGFIFFANIVEASQNFYFPLGEKNPFWYLILRNFIAWINLDLGWQVCLYDGMDTYEHMYIVFAFHLYIWLLLWLLILLSRKCNCMSRLMEKNGTKVLATLILLSYARLMKAVMTSLSTANLKTEHGRMWVWYYNGNIPYLKGKHIPLFLVATVFALFLFPFTFVLLFIRFLRRLSYLWLFGWVNKLKPLFDAYTGPYNDGFQFWPGLLLLIRVAYLICKFLHLGNTLPLLIVAMCSLLLWFHSLGICKNRFVSILEGFLLVDLLLWTLLLAYSKADKPKITGGCVGTVFLAFLAVLFYSGYEQVSKTQFWREHAEKAAAVIITFQQKLKNIKLRCFQRVRATKGLSDESTLLMNAPDMANYSNLREPLIESEED